MNESPADRCGYTYPEGFDPGERHPPDHQSCCYRETWREYERCVWHAEVEDAVEKPLPALREPREPPENRELNHSDFDREMDLDDPLAGSTPAELLDGARLSGQTLTPAADLSHCALRGSDLSGADLEGARLSGAWLHDANGSACDLRKSDLTAAHLSGADLSDATLRAAAMTNLQATDANFENASMEQSTLDQAWLSGSCLADSTMTAVTLESAHLRNADLRSAALTGARLEGASVGQADLTDAGLSGAVLTNASFIGADLTRADLEESEASEATMSNVTLTAAKVADADLTDATLRGADLRHAAFLGADLTGASVFGADLTEASLEGATASAAEFADATATRTDLREAHLESADFQGAGLVGANLERAKLSNADLFDADLLEARLYGTRLGDATIDTETRLADDEHRCVYDPGSAVQYEPDDEVDTDRRLTKAMGAYQGLEKLCSENARPDAEAAFFVRRQDMLRRQRREQGEWGRWLRSWASNLVVRYGESPWRVAGSTAVAVLVCALLYPLYGIRAGGRVVTYGTTDSLVQTGLDSLYFSIVTFTTLGYGDVQPVGLARAIATAETIAGSALLALLVFVFGRRATR